MSFTAEPVAEAAAAHYNHGRLLARPAAPSAGVPG